jgi:Holliday junction resolvase RusA-like endonuclease
MSEIKITVPGVAAPKSIRIIMRNGHPSMANNKRVRGWMTEVATAAKIVMNQSEANYTLRFPFKSDTPIGIMVDVYLPWAKATAKKLAATTGAHLQKPDADNLLKPIMDALSEAGIWTDDNQVDRIFLQKWRCPRGSERVDIVISWQPL